MRGSRFLTDEFGSREAREVLSFCALRFELHAKKDPKKLPRDQLFINIVNYMCNEVRKREDEMRYES